MPIRARHMTADEAFLSRDSLGVVVMSYRADDQPVHSRAEYWHQIVAESLVPLDVELSGKLLDARDRMRVGALGPVGVVALSTGDESHAVRRRSHINRTDGALLKFDLQIRGNGVIDHAGRSSLQRPGDFTLVDLSRPCAWRNGPSAGLLAITFPRDMLPLREDEISGLTGVRVAADRGVAAMASRFAREAPAQLDDLRPGDRVRIGTTVLDLLTTALLSGTGHHHDVTPESRKRALMLSIHAYLEEHLGDPDLSPRSLATAHYVSVRYLHLLFEEERTTVADTIRRRRLERCRRDLLDPALRSQPVAAVAARWGFTSPAHFSRLFRATYGIPPSELRRLHAGEHAVPNDAHT
jgi:AraC-like DNA-binding protein